MPIIGVTSNKALIGRAREMIMNINSYVQSYTSSHEKVTLGCNLCQLIII